MNLKDKINDELKKAMLAKDQTRLDTLRSIRSEILMMDKSGLGREMNEEEELQLLNKQAKMRRDSIEQFKDGGREELAANEAAQLKVIEEFLPKQLSREEAEKVISAIVDGFETPVMADFGKIMGAVMKELKGKVDGKLVQELVKSKLGG
ncbi:GatB/YqeY domain-containing protein [Ignavibacteria bacterium CHB1]|nr:MAG: GatB/YqeY domain-containing protein [Chlorobiota bacterium]MBV6398648.1 putative protein YqeY [Ignavibacteria bacterium]MCC6885184.1 GatB/YqeY domain-containing protein [Ignavibacteriales bacterium]MCE7952026.1 GatB/YqeY domain-containing protein [Chlorobi bacterium CHB7]MDL1886416.1 GatB/YqeY domain-containing protein [Ignavibacteria bacterium CHB1]RIK48861.1 MAG: glutamyl-tRNA amidotransferase [Ignavibacteriota bacterium]